MTGALWLEDVHVGNRFRTDTYDLTADAIIEFATEWDPQPFHLGEDAAQDTFFNGLAASGWHTAAITMRLLVTTGLPLATGIIGASIELAWPSPTRRSTSRRARGNRRARVQVGPSPRIHHDGLRHVEPTRRCPTAHHGSTVGVREAAMTHLTGSAGHPHTTSSRDSGSRSIRNWPTRAASRTPH